MRYIYKPTGVCSREISFEINKGIVSDIQFIGGCPGNLKMISKLLDGFEADKIIEMCSGNLCGNRSTSCADQLAKAVVEASEKEKSCC